MRALDGKSWAALLCAAALACGVRAQVQEQVPAPGASRLVIADAQGDWGLLAPFLHQARGPGYVYSSFVFDTLVWKEADGTLAPALATRWQALPGGRCHRFTLAAGARWHDGKPVTPQDVAFSFDYLRRHHYRFVDLQVIDRVTATPTAKDNAGAVEVCTREPYAPFMANIAAALPVLPAHVYGPVEAPEQFHALAAATGSGPYRLAEYNRAQGFYRLERHAAYHAHVPRYAQVFVVKMNPQLALAAMRRGEVDAASIPALMADAFRTAGFSVLSQPSNHPYRLLFNHAGRFADARLRQGLAHALDRQWLADVAYHGQATVAQTGYRQGLPAQSTARLASYPHDPQRAATLLQAGGWTRGADGAWRQGGTPVKLDMLGDPASEVLAKAVAAQLETLGLTVRLRLEQDARLQQRLKARDFDLALLSSSHEGDPDRFRLAVTGLQQRADDYHANPRLLALLEQQKGMQDPAQREAVLAEAESLYSRDLPAYLLVNPHNFVAYDPRKVAPAFTRQGVAMGIPLPWNKAALFRPAP